MVKGFIHTIASVVAGVFIVQLLLSLFLTFSVYRTRKEQKNSLKCLENSALQKMVFTSAEYAALHFFDKNEFVLNGEMYDIFAVKKENNRVVVFVVKDTKEKRLRAIQERMDTAMKNPEKKPSFYFLYQGYPEKERGEVWFLKRDVVQYREKKLHMKSSPVLSVDVPPPEIIG